MTNFFAALFFLSLPFDSVPLPIPGTTKSLSLIFLPFLCVNLLITKKIQINLSSRLLISFFLYAIPITLIYSGVVNYADIKQSNSLISGINGLITILIFCTSYIVVINYIGVSDIRYKFVLKMMFISTFFPILFSILLFINFFIDSFYINNFLLFIHNFFISHESTYSVGEFGRLFLLSSEPAWAAQQLIVYMIPIILLYKYAHPLSKFLNFYLFLAHLVLFFTITIFGIIYFSILILIFLLKKPSIKLILIYCSSIFFIFFNSELFSYQINKINTILEYGLSYEGSTAIRLYTPIIAFHTFWDNFNFFGIGFNNFGFYLPFYAPDWYSSMPGEGSDLSDIYSSYLGTPRNMYIRILLELGIPGALFFFSFLFVHFIFLKTIKNKVDRKIFFAGYFGILLVFLNYDSFANLYIPTFLALIYVRSKINPDPIKC